MNMNPGAGVLEDVIEEGDMEQMSGGGDGGGAFPDTPSDRGLMPPPAPAGSRAPTEQAPHYRTRITALLTAQQRDLEQLEAERGSAQEQLRRKRAQLQSLRRQFSRLDDEVAELQASVDALWLREAHQHQAVSQHWTDWQQADLMLAQKHQAQEDLVEKFSVYMNELMNSFKSAPGYYEEQRLREDLEGSSEELRALREQELAAMDELRALCGGQAAVALVRPLARFDACDDDSLHLALRVIEDDCKSFIEELAAKGEVSKREARLHQQELNYVKAHLRELRDN